MDRQSDQMLDDTLAECRRLREQVARLEREREEDAPKVEAVDSLAARMAHKAGPGASEWKTFVGAAILRIDMIGGAAILRMGMLTNPGDTP